MPAHGAQERRILRLDRGKHRRLAVQRAQHRGLERPGVIFEKAELVHQDDTAARCGLNELRAKAVKDLRMADARAAVARPDKIRRLVAPLALTLRCGIEVNRKKAVLIRDRQPLCHKATDLPCAMLQQAADQRRLADAALPADQKMPFHTASSFEIAAVSMVNRHNAFLCGR